MTMKISKNIQYRLKNALFLSLQHKHTLLIIFYTIAFGGIVFNTGIYYDDWTLFQSTTKTIIDMYKETGWVFWGYFHQLIQSLPFAVVWYRIITFAAYLLSALCLYKILATIRIITSSDRLWIVLFFVFFPINFSRIGAVNTSYAICYFFFFAAFWLLSMYLHTRQIGVRIAAVILFALSFSTSSFLTFYSLVLLYIFYIEATNQPIVQNVLRRIGRYSDFLLLPCIFWGVKSLFFKSYGLYAGYNKVRLEYIKTMVLTIHQVLYHSFIAPIMYAIELVFKDAQLPIFLGFLVLIIVVFRQFAQKIQYPRSIQYDRADVIFLMLGAWAWFIAVFPYCAVKKMPQLFDWADRHALLVPLGAACILFYGIKICVGSSMRNAIYAFFIALFITANFLGYLDWQRDAFKQLSLIEQIKSSDIIKKNTTLLVQDNTADLNAMQRKYFFYEYTGMLKQVFGDETRLMIDVYDFLKRFPENIQQRIAYPQYHIQHYHIRRPDYKILIFYGDYPMTRTNAIRLTIQRFVAPEQFHANIKNILRFEYVPVDEAQLQEISFTGNIPLEVLQ